MMKMDVIKDAVSTLASLGKMIGGEAGKLFEKISTALLMVTIAVLCPLALLFDMCMGDGVMAKEFFKALGIPKEIVDKIVMALQIVTQIVVGIVMAVLTGGASLTTLAPQLTQTLGQVALKAAQMMQNVLKAIKKILSPIMKAIEAIAPKFAEFLKAGGKSIESAMQKLVDKADDFLQRAEEHVKNYADPKMHESYKQLDQAFKEAQGRVDSLRKSGQNIPGDLLNEVEKAKGLVKSHPLTTAMEDTKKAFSVAINVAKAVPTLIETGVTAQNKILQAQILRLQGAIEVNKTLIGAFIKLLQEVIDQLIAAVRGMSKDMKTVADAHRKIFQDLAQVVAQLCQA
jgi:hypothetical protein